MSRKKETCSLTNLMRNNPSCGSDITASLHDSCRLQLKKNVITSKHVSEGFFLFPSAIRSPPLNLTSCLTVTLHSGSGFLLALHSHTHTAPPQIVPTVPSPAILPGKFAPDIIDS